MQAQIILAALFSVLFAVAPQNTWANEITVGTYKDLNFKEIFFELPKQQIVDKERAVYFENLSKARLSDFLQDGAQVAPSISVARLGKLYEEAINSEVVIDDSVLSLENRNNICYLRALWVHMKLLLAGASDSSIRKLVLEGYINHESVGYPWAYHIVTAAKATDGQWYALDIESSELLTVEKWLEKHQAYQAVNANEDSPYQFLFSVRPSYQWTLIDHKYDLTIDLGDDVNKHIRYVLSSEAKLKARFAEYMKSLN